MGSVSPVVVVMRSTSRDRESMSAVPDIVDYQDEEGNRWHEESERRDAERTAGHLTSYLSQNTMVLMLLFYVALIGEEFRVAMESSNFLFVLFEFCSAYGTVGLSMSDAPWSRSGKWSVPSKLSIIAVMIIGRLRGLPESIDPAIHMHMEDMHSFNHHDKKAVDGDEEEEGAESEDQERELSYIEEDEWGDIDTEARAAPLLTSSV